MQTESTLRRSSGETARRLLLVPVLLFAASCASHLAPAQDGAHPRLLTSAAGIDSAKKWITEYPWYRSIVTEHKNEIDAFIAHGPVYVSPIKQSYVYQMYTCPNHGIELLYEQFRPFSHRCPADTSEVYSRGKYDMAWAGWYNRLLGTDLVWMGILYNIYGDEKYAVAGRAILTNFADLYLSYTTDNTILGPAHVFFGTLSESFWGVDMACGYDLLYNYRGFTAADRKSLKEKLFYPLAAITQKFPETASNRQLWYNNVSAAVGFLYGDSALIDFAIKGRYGFRWQIGSALPGSGFWPEWSGYHFVALRGMICLAEMARHNGYDLYHMEVAGRTMKSMFDAPFLLAQPNFEFPRSKDSGGGSLLEYAPLYEVGYAVYRDRKYASLLNMTYLRRGTQVVGETSALGKAPEPVSMFDIDPDIPRDSVPVYTEGSVNLAGNGFAILRDSTLRTYLYLDYGILGGEHGHPDRLQMGYYAGGRNWIVDPLNESYMYPSLQLWYRRSIAHNTLVVDQTDQAWTNGYGNFFGALPSFQVASGGSTTEYRGVKLTRTLIQVGDYFLDLFDAGSPDVHTYDLPLHSFGALTLDGLDMERQPVDLFGHRPGIPGYDQFTDIDKCETDSSFRGVFTDRGDRLSVRVIGEPGTQVIRALTPPMGGFYKQMGADRVPVPVLITRRICRATRFASLIQTVGNDAPVTSFRKGPEPNSYIVERGNEKDVVRADVGNSVYSIVREKNGIPAFTAAYNTSGIGKVEDSPFNSLRKFNSFQCTNKGRTTSILLDDGGFGGAVNDADLALMVFAPNTDSVLVNGMPRHFKRIRDYVDIGSGFQSTTSSFSDPLKNWEAVHLSDSALFLGMKKSFSVSFLYANGISEGGVTASLTSDWEERLQSQNTWWGGIVNLVPSNKGPVERRTLPSGYRRDASWIDGIVSESGSGARGGSRTFQFSLDVPSDAFPGSYAALFSRGKDTVRESFVVRPPVTATLSLPNDRKESLCVEFKNETPDSISVSAQIKADPSWKAPGITSRTRGRNPLPVPVRTPELEVTLKPLESKRVQLPLQLSGYTKENQLYPVGLALKSGGFTSEITHDFYVGVSHFAKTPPSLDGSWNGWNCDDPMTIDRPSQIGRLLFGNQPWHGVNDLSARIYAMYDRAYLYVGADVTDDSVVSHWDFPRMGYPWDTDCMEVVIDARDNSLQGCDPPTPGTYRHLCLPEYRQTDFSSIAWQGAGAPDLPKPNLIPGGETYFHRVKGGYTIIARFPLAGIPGIMAKPGYKIGFDVAINDNDGTSFRKNQHIWAGYLQNQSWWDLSTIGALVFGPDN
jgi:hypothetical protein